MTAEFAPEPALPVRGDSLLSPDRLEELAAELDRIRGEVLDSRGADDAAYIRRVVDAHRRLELAGRATLFASLFPAAWLAGTALLATSKILENMELGHNVMHGQWDWMRDPAIHSTTWEWDHATPAAQWKHSHNFVHHTYTNVVGRDRDVGYALLRVAPGQPWTPQCLFQLITNAVLAVNFEWGVAVYDAEIERAWRGEKPWRDVLAQLGGVARKGRGQLVKDYVAFPLLAGPAFLPVLTGNLTANVVRNLWTHTVIFCGHFADGVAFFEPECLEDETRGEWYLRQMLGSANIDGPPLLHLMTGNLSHQIEHHLFPDLPSNRYAEIAPQVRALCERFGLPYNSGSLLTQAGRAWGRVARGSLPEVRSLNALPLKALPLKALPLKALPLKALPLKALPLKALPLKALPLKALLGGLSRFLTGGRASSSGPGTAQAAGISRSAAGAVKPAPARATEPWQSTPAKRTAPAKAVPENPASRANVTSGNGAGAARVAGPDAI